MPVVSVPADADTIAHMTKRVAHFEDLLAEIKKGTVDVPDYAAWEKPSPELKFLRPGRAGYDQCRARYQVKIEEDLEQHKAWFANGMPNGIWVDVKDMGCCCPP